MRLFTSGRIDENQFDDEDSILQEKTNELQKKREGIQSQLNLIDDPQKWISWLDEFDKEVDELVKIKDNDEKREILRKYVDVVIVDSQDRNHTITLNLTYPIVNDKLVYKNKSKKRDGYTIREGSKSIVVNTKSFGKKNPLIPPHKTSSHLQV